MFRHIIYLICLLTAAGLTDPHLSDAQTAPGSFAFIKFKAAPQAPRIFFEHLSSREGFVLGGPASTFTDSAGYLWIMRGTAGISRYDGYQIKDFVPDSDDSTTVPEASYYIPPVYDAAGRLWFPCALGMVGFDPKKGTFRLARLGKVSATPYPLICNRDSNGQLWVLGAGETNISYSLYRFDPQKASFDLYDLTAHEALAVYGPEASFQMKNSSLGFMQTDLLGRIWFVYQDGTRPGLMKFEPQSDTWTFYPSYSHPLPPGSLSKLTFTNWMRLAPDQDGEWIWLTGWASGLQGFNLKTLTWQIFGPGYTFCDIMNKSQDELWVAGYERGLFTFDKKTQQFHQYPYRRAQPPAEGPLESQYLSFSRSHDTGILWIAGEKGLTKIDPHLQNFTRPSPLSQQGSCDMLYTDSAVRAVFAFCGLEDGKFAMYKWQEAGNQLQSRTYPTWTEAWGALPTFIQRDSKGRYWAGMGLHLDPHTLELTRVSYPTSRVRPDQLDRPWRGLPMPNGDMWFSNRWGGLFHFDAAEERMQGLDPLRAADTVLLPGVRMALPGGPTQLWLATAYGLVLFDTQTRDYTLFAEIQGDTASLPGRETMDLLFDSKGRLWVCTSEGLCWLDTARQEIHRVPGSAYRYSRMVMDANGDIWAKAAEGLVRYQPATGRIRLYGEQDGLSSSQFERLALSPGGSVMLGNKHIWHPDDFVDNTTPPRVVFTDFLVFDKPFPMARSVHFADEIVLKHTDNFFTLFFSAMNFTQPWLNRYRWQLEGIDPHWVEGGDRHSASYTNLPPGTYTFRVMAANNDGYWSEKPRTLRIRILPAWWQTIWFRGLAALAVAVLTASIYRLQVSRIRAQAEVRSKEAEFAKEKAELAHRLAETEMSALRAQMNPHFLFNVLMSIDRFLLENAPLPASSFLNKFSRLIRLVLENSHSDHVILVKELEALRLYLELEALRFKEKVRWKFDIDPRLDLRHIRIPPMLLQPFVENAIWHGLLHKDEGGLIRIALRQLDENLLRIEIEDDGIGRAKAAEIKSRSAVLHKSFGMQLTQERLNMIFRLYEQESRIQVIDLQNDAGEACGTRVIMDIPV